MNAADFLAPFAGASYFFLQHIGEPQENGLRLLLEEASPRSGPTESRRIGGVAITGLRSVEPDGKSRRFELCWSPYVAYAVTNESYATADKGAVYQGELVRIYTRSAYLDFVAASTFATSDYPDRCCTSAVAAPITSSMSWRLTCRR